ncbi:HNH endonuclease [Kitasatospora gansuensis]|uniref:HNH nuclease domain-containing protein n=1 Tax=Kitasatospora nipponensis TaxID=258049 RepID=A0ABN1TB92_9ACTN|nr:HNH endonuclease signature motif containing protein [Kitasatospora gansuensis]
MRCIDCPDAPTHRGRCRAHHTAYEARPSVRARRRLQRLVSRHHSGTERLRRLVDRAGSARCELCGEDFPAELVDIDHRTPLALGGEDTDANVWALCRACHRLKTSEDFEVIY